MTHRADGVERRLISRSEAETARLAEALARSLSQRRWAAAVIGLKGPLGAGKSVFARAFVRGFLGEPDAEVPSPTFTLVQTYPGPDGAPEARPELWHADLYRLAAPDDIVELDLLEAFANAVVLVEWPEQAGRYWPAEALMISLRIGDDDDSRQLHLSGPASWTPVIEALV